MIEPSQQFYKVILFGFKIIPSALILWCWTSDTLGDAGIREGIIVSAIGVEQQQADGAALGRTQSAGERLARQHSAREKAAAAEARAVATAEAARLQSLEQEVAKTRASVERLRRLS
eukprot:SAG22_NODE_293_length_12891_cov_17.337242_2_plen_117_part_00